MPETKSVASTSDQDINGLLSSVAWAVNGLTYSFPTSSSFYEYGFWPNFAVLNGTQQSAVNSILAVYASFANLSFTQVTESDSNHGDLRFAMSSAAAPTAFAYYPSSSPQGGDSWYDSDGTYNNPIKGNYAFTAFLHEIGHALGLKHGHETDTYGAMTTAHDSMEYSVMTYRSYVGASTTGGYTNETWGYAQTPMMYDIAALQYMYGANFNQNSGNTTYSWSPATGEMFVNGVGQSAPGGNRIFLTVWDGDGTDTYDFSNYSTNLQVDLRPGFWTTASSTQLANLHVNGTQIADGNIANALLYNSDPRSLIENAIGSSGNDIFIGNAENNVFTGNGGTDTVVFAGNRSAFTFIETNDYIVSATGHGSDTLISVERFQFNDFTVTDDYRGGNATTGTIASGALRTGDVQFIGDHDWFSVTLTANQTYSILLSGSATDSGTLGNPFLHLFNSSSVLVGQDDDAGTGSNSHLVFRPGTTGTYYLEAGSFSTELGTYLLALQPDKFLSDGSWTGAGSGSQGWYIGDFSGDGRDDVLRYTDGVSGAQVFTSNGSAFAGGSNWTGAGNFGHWYVGDFNADGRDDVFRYNPGVSGAEVFLSNGTAFTGGTSWTGAGNGSQDWYIGDFNGDGRDDVLRYIDGVSGAQVFTSNGTAFTGGSSWTAAGNDGRWNVGDFNGDGLDDIFRYSPGVSGAEMFLSNGSSFVASGSWTGAGNGSEGWYVGDFNADGLDDIMRYNPGVSGGEVFLSNGSAFVQDGSWTGAEHGTQPWYVGDYNGDGFDEIFRYVPGTSGAEVFFI